MAASPELLLALAKFNDDKVRDAIGIGEYPIDTLVRVRGKMTVAPDHEAKVATAIPWQRLFALALSKLNNATVESLVAEALRANGQLEGATQEISERARVAVERIVGTSKRTVRGAVRVDLSIEELVTK